MRQLNFSFNIFKIQGLFSAPYKIRCEIFAMSRSGEARPCHLGI